LVFSAALLSGWFVILYHHVLPSLTGWNRSSRQQAISPQSSRPPPVKVRMIWITFCLLRLPPTVSWLDDPLFYVWVKYESALIAAVVLD